MHFINTVWGGRENHGQTAFLDESALVFCYVADDALWSGEMNDRFTTQNILHLFFSLYFYCLYVLQASSLLKHYVFNRASSLKARPVDNRFPNLIHALVFSLL